MSTEPDAPPLDHDATQQDDDGPTAEEIAAERAHAERIEEDLALLRDILDFHGRNLISWSYTPNEKEQKAFERLGMTPKDSKDPQIRMRRLWRERRRIIFAKSLLSILLLAIRENHHGTWLRLELAHESLKDTLFNGMEKKTAILAILDIIWEARQELSRIHGFIHLAPGWRDHDTKGGRKKKIRTPTERETLERVRTIAAQLKDDLASIDRRFAQIEIDRVAELLQENTTLERVTGYLVQESGAFSYKITTAKARDKLISNFEDWDRERKSEAREANEEARERVKKRSRKGT